jgi:hypothetical protein
MRAGDPKTSAVVVDTILAVVKAAATWLRLHQTKPAPPSRKRSGHYRNASDRALPQ